MSILDKIVAKKKAEVIQQKSELALDELKQRGTLLQTLGFSESLRSRDFPAIIAEIKKASPSLGVFRADLEPVETALKYKDAGAAAISVLTDEEFFSGKLEYLQAVRKSVPGMPLLRKDFIVDEYQIYQSKVFGADAILLIARVLDKNKLFEFFSIATELGLECLIEVHNSQELEHLVLPVESSLSNNTPLPLVGINNRDLSTFITNRETTAVVCNNLMSFLGTSALNAGLQVVSESGISEARHLKELADYGANGYLIGESLVIKGCPGENLKKLIENAQELVL